MSATRHRDPDLWSGAIIRLMAAPASLGMDCLAKPLACEYRMIEKMPFLCAYYSRVLLFDGLVILKAAANITVNRPECQLKGRSRLGRRQAKTVDFS